MGIFFFFLYCQWPASLNLPFYVLYVLRRGQWGLWGFIYRVESLRTPAGASPSNKPCLSRFSDPLAMCNPATLVLLWDWLRGCLACVSGSGPPDAVQSPLGDYTGFPGCGLLRLHSTYRHDLKIYASDEGRVQMTAAAFAKVRTGPWCSRLTHNAAVHRFE